MIEHSDILAALHPRSVIELHRAGLISRGDLERAGRWCFSNLINDYILNECKERRQQGDEKPTVIVEPRGGTVIAGR
jgi:hypothetical protein